MKVAVVGLRGLCVDISAYIPKGVSLIISGGAVGIDSLAERWADEHKVPKLILKPDYKRYGRAAPIQRNKLIAEAADLVLAVWDGSSRGTKFTIDYAEQIGKQVKIIKIKY